MPNVDLTIGPPGEPEVNDTDTEALAPEDFDAVVDDAPHVDESVVRTMLRSVGGVTSYAIGRDDVPDHWQFTQRELDDLTPPLTRYINARPRVRRAVARGDEAAMGLVLASYVGRNIAAGSKAAIEEKKANAQLQREADGTQDASGTVTRGSDGADSNGQARYAGPSSMGGAVH